MSRFKKNGKKELPEINNSSMSDIIFMFLFFFMVITTMRESDAKVKFTAPSATEYQKLDKKGITAIYMGEPKVTGVPLLDNSVSIQLNDKFARTTSDGLSEDIKAFVASERAECEKKKGNANAITYCLKIDGGVRMTAVNQLKLAMRKNNALKINYATNKDKKRK